jgi:hypothetical protein
LVWDDPGRAEREMEEALAGWIPKEESFQVQHFFALHSASAIIETPISNCRL